jgi:hypothetical protein
MDANDRDDVERWDVEQWYVARDGKRYGPYSLLTLVEAAKQGVVSADSQLWRSGWDAWRPAGSVPCLFGAADPAPPAAIAPEQKAPEEKAPEQNEPEQRQPLTEQPKRRNYVLRHWRGELSLPVAYWVNGLLVLVVTSLVTFAFTALMQGGYAAPGAPAAALLLGFFVLLTSLSAWQMVGIWRSATRHAAKGSAFWAVVAKVIVIIGAVRVAVEMIGTGAPLVIEHVRIALGDQRYGESRWRLLRDGTELAFVGGINIGAASELAHMLDAAAQVRVLHLNSSGGRIAEAERMGAEVRKRGLITYVSERCESACTHVFLAGRERWIGERAVLGFHRPSSPLADQERDGNLIEHERRRLTALGLPRDFIAKVLDTPSDEIWRPSPAELLAAGVISGIADGSRFAASGYAASLSPAEFKQGILNNPLFAALQRADPDAFEEVLARLRDAYRRGVPEDEIVAGARALMSNVIRKKLPYASDDVLLQSVDLHIGYMDALKSVDPEGCVAIEDASRGAQLTRDLAKLLPALADKELPLNQSIIESKADQRPAIPTDAQVEPYLAKVRGRLARRSGLRLELIERPKLAPEEFKPFCETMLAFYREVRALPTNEAVAVLRNIYADPGR